MHRKHNTHNNPPPTPQTTQLTGGVKETERLFRKNTHLKINVHIKTIILIAHLNILLMHTSK
jgi:hypothetical protein